MSKARKPSYVYDESIQGNKAKPQYISKSQRYTRQREDTFVSSRRSRRTVLHVSQNGSPLTSPTQHVTRLRAGDAHAGLRIFPRMEAKDSVVTETWRLISLQADVRVDADRNDSQVLKYCWAPFLKRKSQVSILDLLERLLNELNDLRGDARFGSDLNPWGLNWIDWTSTQGGWHCWFLSWIRKSCLSSIHYHTKPPWLSF